MYVVLTSLIFLSPHEKILLISGTQMPTRCQISMPRPTALYVSGSSKIQALCPMTQVVLKLRFTWKDSQFIKVSFLYL